MKGEMRPKENNRNVNSVARFLVSKDYNRYRMRREIHRREAEGAGYASQNSLRQGVSIIPKSNHNNPATSWTHRS